jgi:hypothetical protein
MDDFDVILPDGRSIALAVTSANLPIVAHS